MTRSLFIDEPLLAQSLPPAWGPRVGAASSSVHADNLRHIFASMEGRFADFPANYVVLDVETTGLRADDLITQIGAGVVIGHRLESLLVCCIDWTYGASADFLSKLAVRLAETRQQIEYDRQGRATGRKFGATLEGLKSGQPVGRALLAAVRFLRSVRDMRMFLVMHNGMHFDCPRLEQHFREWLRAEDAYVFDREAIIDTGMIEKAAEAGVAIRPGESMLELAQRLAGIHQQGVFWNLHRHCTAKYGLADPSGSGASEASAAHDCVLTHRLFETYCRQWQALVAN